MYIDDYTTHIHLTVKGKLQNRIVVALCSGHEPWETPKVEKWTKYFYCFALWKYNPNSKPKNQYKIIRHSSIKEFDLLSEEIAELLDIAETISRRINEV